MQQPRVSPVKRLLAQMEERAKTMQRRDVMELPFDKGEALSMADEVLQLVEMMDD